MILSIILLSFKCSSMNPDTGQYFYGYDKDQYWAQSDADQACSVSSDSCVEMGCEEIQ